MNSKYHDVNEFQNLKIEKNLNIFHSNVNGLEAKLDALHTFLSASKSSMDILAITETSENDSTSFLSNVNIDGYTVIPPFIHLPSLLKEVQLYTLTKILIRMRDWI